MDQARVVEIWVPDVKRVGSGYILADGLVLTSYHLVHGMAPGALVRVRALDMVRHSDWLDATLRWPSGVVDTEAFPERDAALLVVDNMGDAGPFVGKVSFGKVTGQDRIPCQAVGFPNAEKRPNNVRDTMSVRGHIDALQARKSGLLTVHVDQSIVPRRKDAGSAWAGASGAAVFCQDLLVGVLATDRALAESASVLNAVPLTGLANLPGFREVLDAHDVGFTPAPASAVERRLTAYTQAALLAAARQPYTGAGEGVMPPLAAVYLRQHARRHETGPSGHRSVPPQDGPSVLPLEGADEILADPLTCVILAGPGGGKSSLLRARLADGVRHWPHTRTGNLLPVLVRAELLADRPLPQALAAAARSNLVGGPFPEEFFANPPWPGAHWLVLVDGLDEVHDPARRRKVLETVVTASGGNSQLYRFVIATRPLPEGELNAALGPDVPSYELQPFSPDELARVALGWFEALGLPDPAHTAERFIQTLERSKLAEVARIPLIIAMLCQLHAEKPDQELPNSRGELYDNFVALLGKGRLRADSQQGELGSYSSVTAACAQNVLDHLLDLIGCLAVERINGNTERVVAIIQTRRLAHRPKEVLTADWHAFLTSALRNTGLLVPQGDGDLTFLHLTFGEHLAARHITSLPPRGAHTKMHPLCAVRPEPLRCIEWNPGLRRGVRWWRTPKATPSYAGFLLDAQSARDAEASTLYVKRLIRAGSYGWLYISQLQRLGTAMPSDLASNASDLLYYRAVKARGFERLGHGLTMALMLFEDPQVADVFYGQTNNRKIDYHWRVWAASNLLELGDPRGADMLYALTEDMAMTKDGFSRVGAAKALASVGDPRGVDALHSQALDVRLEDFHRQSALRMLIDLNRDLGAEVLRSQALDPSIYSWVRVQAAEKLAKIDKRGADILHAQALDPSMDSWVRVQAAEKLAKIDKRGADILHAQALDPSMDSWVRVQAAEKLAEIDIRRGHDVFHAQALDSTLPIRTRRASAKNLVEGGDTRGANILASSKYRFLKNLGRKR
ncbi:NACHT domain-containing protein [Streptomyces sp. CBMAI 2042]|uniref:NACHT domain-containing protein n=1 Tax=Streptomyces sp. CBMAI 2042 TaxID=2305222 RepID=UPI001F1B1497|nr:trypsin-like peptidase domain-containing protein [Streptomyces sp. CBMAI 2042]